MKIEKIVKLDNLRQISGSTFVDDNGIKWQRTGDGNFLRCLECDPLIFLWDGPLDYLLFKGKYAVEYLNLLERLGINYGQQQVS